MNKTHLETRLYWQDQISQKRLITYVHRWFHRAELFYKFQHKQISYTSILFEMQIGWQQRYSLVECQKLYLYACWRSAECGVRPRRVDLAWRSGEHWQTTAFVYTSLYSTAATACSLQHYFTVSIYDKESLLNTSANVHLGLVPIIFRRFIPSEKTFRIL